MVGIMEIYCCNLDVLILLHSNANMKTGIEIDQRAVEFLQKKLPAVNILHQDVLKVDWPSFAAEKGGPLSLIGNLPYNITSQILFSLIDSYKAVNKAVVTAQYEVISQCG